MLQELRFRPRTELNAACVAAGYGLPAINTLTLLLSFRCNMACGHCAFRCHPARRGVMDLRLAKAAIRGARASSEEMIMVSLSGGEPFLFPRLVEQIVRYACENGLYSAIVTNAHWAASEARARQVLEPLVRYGLIDFTTSFDTFHARFVSANKVRHAAVAAQDLGIRVHINVAVGGAGALRGELVPELLRIERARFTGANAMTVTEFVPVATGFAARPRIASALPFPEGGDTCAGPCVQVLRNPSVTPDGSLYACCGTGGAHDHGPGRDFLVGNIRRSSLADLSCAMQGRLFYSLLSAIGPARLVELADSEGLITQAPRSHHSSCDVCHRIHTDTLLRKGVSSLLKKLACFGGAASRAIAGAGSRRREDTMGP